MTKYLSGRIKEEVMSNAKYILCFTAVTVIKLVQVLYSIYMVLWITHFIELGVLADAEEAKTIYKNVLTIGAVAAIISVPIIGKLADSLPTYIFLPLSFFIRGALITQFDLIDDPRTVYSVFISVAVILASTIQFIVV